MVILVAVILRSPDQVILLIESFVYEMFGLCWQLKPPCRATTTGWRGHAGTATARGWRSTGAGRTWLASPPPTGWLAAAPTAWACGPTATARPAGRSAPRTRQVSKGRLSLGCSQFTGIYLLLLLLPSLSLECHFSTAAVKHLTKVLEVVLSVTWERSNSRLFVAMSRESELNCCPPSKLRKSNGLLAQVTWSSRL